MEQNKLSKALVMGAGGFIGSHMVKRLKKEGFWVRGVDLKYPEYAETAADEFVQGDLRDPLLVKNVMSDIHWDEVYQFAADMGGAGFVFTGENDADIMHNSALVNLNVAHQAAKDKNTARIFYSSSACMYPEHNQLDPNNPNCVEDSAYPADPDSEYKHDWRHFHIKASNGAFIQVVSVFAVGYADQFLSVNGGDMSITNSNSNFGQISLRAAGSKFKADPPSANGKITALIPPAGISKVSQYAEIYPINADITWEENLGDTATAVKSDWENRKIQFAQLNASDKFKLYIEIPGVEKDTDIPELVVESEDLNDGSTKIKRFLTTSIRF